jgi:hypothetical protein
MNEIALDVYKIFHKHGIRGRYLIDMLYPRHMVSLLMGRATDIRVYRVHQNSRTWAVEEGRVLIQPHMLEDDHYEAWSEVTKKYLDRIVVPEKTKGAFLS